MKPFFHIFFSPYLSKRNYLCISELMALVTMPWWIPASTHLVSTSLLDLIPTFTSNAFRSSFVTCFINFLNSNCMYANHFPLSASSLIQFPLLYYLFFTLYCTFENFSFCDLLSPLLLLFSVWVRLSVRFGDPSPDNMFSCPDAHIVTLSPPVYSSLLSGLQHELWEIENECF